MYLFFKKTILAIVLGFSVVALTGCKSDKQDNFNAVSIINKITQNQFKIIDHFKEKDYTGYVAESHDGGQPIIFYADNKNKTLIYGTVFDEKGDNLTQQYTDKNIKPAQAKKLFDAVNDTTSFLIGKQDAAHQIYFIGEPNCSMCHKFYLMLKPYVDAGKLSIRFIMTAFLRQDSAGKAAAILQSDDPVSMLNVDESKFNLKTEEGAIKPLPHDQIKDKTTADLKANLAFMAKNNIRGTPTVFYQDIKGQSMVIDGVPNEDIETLLKNIGKLPAVVTKQQTKTASIPDKAQTHKESSNKNNADKSEK